MTTKRDLERLAVLRDLCSQLGHEDTQYAAWWAEVAAIEAGQSYDPLPDAVRHALHERRPVINALEVEMLAAALRAASVSVGDVRFKNIAAAGLALFRAVAADLAPHRVQLAQQRLAAARALRPPTKGSRQSANRAYRAATEAGFPSGVLPDGLVYSHRCICTEAEHQSLGAFFEQLGDRKPKKPNLEMERLAAQFLEGYRAEHGWPELLPKTNYRAAA